MDEGDMGEGMGRDGRDKVVGIKGLKIIWIGERL